MLRDWGVVPPVGELASGEDVWACPARGSWGRCCKVQGKAGCGGDQRGPKRHVCTAQLSMQGLVNSGRGRSAACCVCAGLAAHFLASCGSLGTLARRD